MLEESSGRRVGFKPNRGPRGTRAGCPWPGEHSGPLGGTWPLRAGRGDAHLSEGDTLPFTTWKRFCSSFSPQ